MWRRRKTGVLAVVTGAVLLIAGLVDHVFAAPKAALCQSGLGQFVQDLDGTVAHDCGLVTTLEAATGWLLVFGVLVGVFGAAVLYSHRAAEPAETLSERRRSRPAAHARPGSAGPPPPAPPGSP